MMEKFCQGSIVVQTKVKAKARKKVTKQKQPSKEEVLVRKIRKPVNGNTSITRLSESGLPEYLQSSIENPSGNLIRFHSLEVKSCSKKQKLSLFRQSWQANGMRVYRQTYRLFLRTISIYRKRNIQFLSTQRLRSQLMSNGKTFRSCEFLLEISTLSSFL